MNFYISDLILEISLSEVIQINYSHVQLYFRSEQTLKRSGTGPVGKVAHGRSNHSRVKSFRLLPSVKSPVKQAPPPSSSSVPASSVCSSTLPSIRSPPSSLQLSSVPKSGEQNDSPRTALIK